MTKVISQETYDDVLKENIVEFSMSVEEAREETIQQFEAQVGERSTFVTVLTSDHLLGNP